MAAIRHLLDVIRVFGPPKRVGYLVVFVTVQNSVKIS